MEDLEALQGDLLRELAASHTTLRIPSPDSNRSRWPYHPLWDALIAHAERYCAERDIEIVARYVDAGASARTAF